MKTVCGFGLLLFMTLAHASETIPYRFKPGGVISAEMMNEIFQKVNNVTEGFTSPDELVGTWSCAEYNSQGGTALDCAGDSSWTTDSSGLFSTRVQTISAVSSSANTYQLTVSSGAPTRCGLASYANTPFTAQYTIVNGYLVWSPPYGRPMIAISKVTPNKFKWTSLAVNNGQSMVCTRTNLAPQIPTGLAASTSGLAIGLSWTDTSSDEPGFKISRRDSLTGDWVELAATASDVTSYLDSVPVAGEYWYRVYSSNSNGDSLGSNLILVEAQ